MNHKERMLAGLPYKGCFDGIYEERHETMKKMYAFNACNELDDYKKRDKLARAIFGKVGKDMYLCGPIYCNHGVNIEIGDNFFANINLTILDVAKVKIGNNVLFGPNVSLYTAGHPIHPESRKSGYEYGMEIIIGDNVWIGGNVVVNPGVHIGNNVVVGSGSVVTRDMPDNVVCAGNPCRVIREITDEDRKYYYKDREFDVEDY